MKKYWKYVALSITCLLAFSCLSACRMAEKADPGENMGQLDAPYIAVIAKGFQHKFWQTVKQGAEQAANDLGVRITYEGPDTEAQIDKQVEMVDAAISKNPVAICIAALDSKAVLGSLEKAAAKGIKVVGFDSGVESDLVAATAATNNTAAAALAADKLAEAIGKKGKIGMVVHDQVSTTGRARRDGFKNRIEEAYPDIEIVDIQYGEGDHTRSADAAKAMMTANPDLVAIYGANEGSAIGVMLAVEELGKVGKVQVVGFDSGKKQVDSIREGHMLGAVTQNPMQLGYKAVEAAYHAAQGKPVEKEIDTGFEWYDKSNVDSEKIRPLLYD
ncbi:MAG: BMP family ABC transporter substrate-binding protein [Ruminococcaceae bacterium]|nr:BMP family ABC transporter substrate-binding protein [Oscillospiraceae bacterium]